MRNLALNRPGEGVQICPENAICGAEIDQFTGWKKGPIFSYSLVRLDLESVVSDRNSDAPIALELYVKPCLAGVSEAGKKAGQFLTVSVSLTLTAILICVSKKGESGSVELAFVGLKLPWELGSLLAILGGGVMLYKSSITRLYEQYLIEELAQVIRKNELGSEAHLPAALASYPSFTNLYRLAGAPVRKKGGPPMNRGVFVRTYERLVLIFNFFLTSWVRLLVMIAQLYFAVWMHLTFTESPLFSGAMGASLLFLVSTVTLATELTVFKKERDM